MKLFRNSADLQHWTAYLPETGWFCFPAAEKGWERRRATATPTPSHLREVPLWLAFNTGLLEVRHLSEKSRAA